MFGNQNFGETFQNFGAFEKIEVLLEFIKNVKNFGCVCVDAGVVMIGC